MQRVPLLIAAVELFAISVYPSTLRGKINDSNTGEVLVGSTIYINELEIGTISGLDGTYLIKDIPAGQYSITCSYVSYEPAVKSITVMGNEAQSLNFKLTPITSQLDAVTIVGHSDKGSETSARNSEKKADQVMNVVSAKTIELSPDLQVANVVQRMSGVTLDKKSSGTGQYALLRGMDKRYNYTLINGVKIPSTHNKHRYVSLDLFPSDMVDRMEVTKALTPNMEGPPATIFHLRSIGYYTGPGSTEH